MPWPPTGLCTCAASPARNARPRPERRRRAVVQPVARQEAAGHQLERQGRHAAHVAAELLLGQQPRRGHLLLRPRCSASVRVRPGRAHGLVRAGDLAKTRGRAGRVRVARACQASACPAWSGRADKRRQPHAHEAAPDKVTAEQAQLVHLLPLETLYLHAHGVQPASNQPARTPADSDALTGGRPSLSDLARTAGPRARLWHDHDNAEVLHAGFREGRLRQPPPSEKGARSSEGLPSEHKHMCGFDSSCSACMRSAALLCPTAPR